MFTPLPAEKHNPIAPVRITRTADNTGWQVHGAHPRVFKDSDYEHSYNNAYMAAVIYSETMTANSKRAWSTDRNFKLIEKRNRAKVMQLHVRITKPLGGYKHFLVTPTGPAHAPVLLDDIRLAVVAAVKWFHEEREKCQDAITSKNIAVKSKRTSQRRSLLFGEFIP